MVSLISRYCPQCGKFNASAGRFCRYCGSKFSTPETRASKQLPPYGRPRDGGLKDGDAELPRRSGATRASVISEDHHFSASALKTFDECPMQYRFKYVSRIPTSEKTYFNLGSAVHSVIEHLTRQELNGIAPTREHALTVLRYSWSSAAYTSIQQEREDEKSAEQMIDVFLAWHAQNDNQVVDVEKDFTYNLRGRKVKGFIDRVEMTPEGDYIIIDFKTGDPSETSDSIEENIQMNVYCLAILKKYGALPCRASLFYLRHNKMVDYFPDSEQLDKQKMRLTGMIDAVLLEQFPAKPAPQTCQFCDYDDLCDESASKGITYESA